MNRVAVGALGVMFGLGANAETSGQVIDVSLAAAAPRVDLTGEITGTDIFAYRVVGQRGQRLHLVLDSESELVRFAVFEPGRWRDDRPLATSDQRFGRDLVPQVNRLEATLPATGDYRIAVSRYAAAVRTPASVAFTLTIELEGGTGTDVFAPNAGFDTVGHTECSVRGIVQTCAFGVSCEQTGGATVVLQLPEGAVRSLWLPGPRGDRSCFEDASTWAKRGADQAD